jgi:hypothetical protein
MAEPLHKNHTDRLGGVLWMAFGLAIAVGAWRMDRFESMGAAIYTAPGLVPGIYGVLMMALGGLLALRRRPPLGAEADAHSGQPLLNRRIAVMLVLALAYAALAIGRLPFGPVTAVFVAIFCGVFSDQPSMPRRVLTAVATGVLTAVTVVLVFERVFLVRLP